MECSNCGEVLESGCSVSAGLRQEDRLILDWERRHKGRSCSGALRPFGKLKWQKKGLLIHTSLVLQDGPPQNHLLAYEMLPYVVIQYDRNRLAQKCNFLASNVANAKERMRFWRMVTFFFSILCYC